MWHFNSKLSLVHIEMFKVLGGGAFYDMHRSLPYRPQVEKIKGKGVSHLPCCSR